LFDLGKYVLIVLMFVGCIGIMMFVVVFALCDWWCVVCFFEERFVVG